MAASYRETPVLAPLFNSEYCQIFTGIFFEEHLRTAASEYVLMKVRKIKIYSYFVTLNFTLKNRIFENHYQKQVLDWYFMIGFP